MRKTVLILSCLLALLAAWLLWPSGNQPVTVAKKITVAPAPSVAASAALAVPGVLRIKGRIAIAGKAAPATVQAVGPRLETSFSPGTVANGLVVIGLRALDRATVGAALAG